MSRKGWAGKGSTRQWRRTREYVLARDKQRCHIGIPGVCTGHAPLRGVYPAPTTRVPACASTSPVCTVCPSGHVHHPQGKGAGDDPRYLEAACAACNLHVGDPTKSVPDAEQEIKLPDWLS